MHLLPPTENNNKPNGKLTIKNPGPMTLIQDFGRFGHQHIGYTPSGPMDEHAFLWANKLLGNSLYAAQLEITLGPFSAVFSQATTIAICGAASNIFINDQPVNSWQSFFIKAEDKLTIKPSVNGLRTYLAIKGGFIEQQHRNSVAMNSRENTGPNNGKPFTINSQLNYHSATTRTIQRYIPESYKPNYQTQISLGIIPGYQYSSLTKTAIDSLLNSEYTITPLSNRMGYRLDGNAIIINKNTLLSEGVTFGTIQIPPDGNPIILLKDRQTIGGYPKIGTVNHIDCFRLSQRRPGEKITFRLTTLEKSQAELKRFYSFFVK